MQMKSGIVKEMSNGAVPCILAHILIDTLAVSMLVQSNISAIFILVIVEIIVSLLVYKFNQKQKSN